MKNLVFAVLLFISGIAAAVSISSAVADTYAPVEVPCPLGGRNARGVEIMSQSFFDRLLDGEPVGAHGEPNPPPECPDNGFLVYKDNFSACSPANYSLTAGFSAMCVQPDQDQ